MRRPRAAFAKLLSGPARCGLALVVAVLLSVVSARAATVAILRPAHDSPELREALFRLKGELLSVGLEVVVEARLGSGGDSTSPEARARLERLATERQLDALLELLGEERPTGVDVWISDRTTQRLDVTRVTPQPHATDTGESLAIHAIEVLRSRFLVVDAPAAPRAAEAPPRDRAPPAARETRRRLGVELGAAVLTGVDGVGPALLPLLRFDYVVDSRLVLHATAAGFGTRGDVDGGVGRVSVDQQFGLLGLCLCRAGAQLAPMASLSAGVLRTGVEGRVALPELGHRAHRVSFLVDASVGARAALSSRYFLTLGGHVQLAEPYVAIHVLDRVVASSGRPNLLLALTVGGWP